MNEFDDLEKELREIEQENKLDSKELYELINRYSYEQLEEINRLTKGIKTLIEKWKKREKIMGKVDVNKPELYMLENCRFDLQDLLGEKEDK